MKCPFCHRNESKVLDSRITEAGDSIRRRRECASCKKRFTTYERVEEIPLTVIKKDGTHEPFDRNKILTGLLRATVKRKAPREKLENIIDEIESDLRNNFRYEVKSKEIGEMILEKLLRIDKVAYIRFASVYREFQDTAEFLKELNRLEKRAKKIREEASKKIIEAAKKQKASS